MCMYRIGCKFRLLVQMRGKENEKERDREREREREREYTSQILISIILCLPIINRNVSSRNYLHLGNSEIAVICNSCWIFRIDTADSEIDRHRVLISHDGGPWTQLYPQSDRPRTREGIANGASVSKHACWEVLVVCQRQWIVAAKRHLHNNCK